MGRIELRFFCVFLFLCLCLFHAPDAVGAEIYIPALNVKSGRSVDVPIMIDQVENLAGIKLVLEYDAKLLEYKNAAKTDKTSSLMHIVNAKKPGLLIVVMAGPQGIKGKKFAVILLTFQARKDLKNTSEAQFKIKEAQLMSDQLKNIEFTTKADALKVVP